MCTMSMVMDQWRPWVPTPVPTWPPPHRPPATAPPPTTIPVQPRVAVGTTNDLLRALLESLRKAIDAAETFDRIKGEPDCVDPDKAKLMERVEELERRLAEVETTAPPLVHTTTISVAPRHGPGASPVRLADSMGRSTAAGWL